MLLKENDIEGRRNKEKIGNSYLNQAINNSILSSLIF